MRLTNIEWKEYSEDFTEEQFKIVQDFFILHRDLLSLDFFKSIDKLTAITDKLSEEKINKESGFLYGYLLSLKVIISLKEN